MLMSKTDKGLAETLGVNNDVKLPVKAEPEIIINTPHELDDADADYNLSRRTFRDLIIKGNQAMESLTDLAKESESPRAYEVLSTMMRTIADTTKDLYDLQKKTKDLKGIPKDDKPSVNVEKAVFVGTTAELLQQIKSKKEEPKTE